MTIQIPGYTPIFENRVYGKDETVTTAAQAGTAPKELLIRKILMPTKYTQPTEDDVVEYIQSKARNAVTGLALPPGLAKTGSTKAAELLNNLPDQVIQHLRIGNEQCIEFVRQNISALQLEEGKEQDKYLHARYGILPVTIIEKNAEAGAIKSSDWYTTALMNDDLKTKGVGQRFTLKILLQNGAMYSKTDIDFLVKHRTHGSRTLEVSRQNYDPAEVNDIIGRLYAGLSSIPEMEKVHDITDKILDEEACLPLVALHKMVEEQLMQQQIMKQIMRQKSQRT